MGKTVFGIDFGNTNVAVVQITTTLGNQKITQLGTGGQPFPSILAINGETGKVLYGREVKSQRQYLAQDHAIVSSFKSWLGTDKAIAIGDKNYNGVTLTSLLLKGIMDTIKNEFNVEITEATFSVPVDFSSKQRVDLREAARLAGIQVLGFISESTAAYIGSQEALGGYTKVAVFDWGGGTLDISVLEKEGTLLKELAVSGKELGGDFIDLILAHKIHGKFVSQRGFDAFDELLPGDRDKILDNAEGCKINLSTDDEHYFHLINYCGERRLKSVMTISEFTRLIIPQIKEAARLLEDTLIKADSLAGLDAILMVGGSSSIRAMREIIEQTFAHRNIQVVYPEDSQWAAAKGAARIGFVNSGYRLEQTIGVLLSDQTIHPLLSPNTILPAESEEIRFGVIEETITATIIIVDENKNTLLLETLPVKGFTTEGIKIKANIDEDLIGSVSIKSTHRPTDVRNIELPSLNLSYDLEIKTKKPRVLPLKLKTPQRCSYRGCDSKLYRDGKCREHFMHERATSR